MQKKKLLNIECPHAATISTICAAYFYISSVLILLHMHLQDANEGVGVKITLDDDYMQLLSTPAKRQQVLYITHTHARAHTHTHTRVCT